MDIDLSNVAAVLVVVSPLALLLIRIFAVPDGVSLDDVIPPLRELEWPRGVQEEEPVRWRVERIRPPRQIAPAQRRASSQGDRVDPAGVGLGSNTAA